MPTIAAPLKSVLVPTDFSPGAQLALERALTLPLAPNAKVTLLHVLPADIPGTLRKAAIAEGKRATELHAAQAHRWARERGLAEHATIVAVVTLGPAAATIAKRAAATKAELIVMGRHGRRPVSDWFIGTTAQKVVRLSDAPVLLVRVPIVSAYASPLIAVDAEPSAEKVLSMARRVLPETGAKVPVLHVSAVPFEDFVTLSTLEHTSYRDRFAARAMKTLRGLVKKVGGKRGFEPTVRHGDARTLIQTTVSEAANDLVVLGTHGKKGLERFFVGSVSEWVLTHVSSDVLVVRS